MNRDTIVLLQTIATLAATIAAISAIAIGFYQFQNQQYNEDQIAHANIKPLLEFRFEFSDDEKLIKLINLGLGTAIITSIKFYKDEDANSSVLNAAKLTNLVYNSTYDFSWSFSDSQNYIQEGESLIISKITKDYLKKENFNDDQIDEIMKSWEDQNSKIHVEITYTDVLGEKQGNIDGYLFFLV
jgi:hypothetical protein